MIIVNPNCRVSLFMEVNVFSSIAIQMNLPGMTTFIKAKLKKSDDHSSIEKYRIAIV